MSDKALSFEDYVLDDYDFNLYSDEDLAYLWEWAEMDDFSDLQGGGGGSGFNTYMMDAPEDEMKAAQPPPKSMSLTDNNSPAPPSMPQGLMPETGGNSPSMPQALMPQRGGGASSPPSMPKGLLPQGGGGMPSLDDFDIGDNISEVPDLSSFGIEMPQMPSVQNKGGQVAPQMSTGGGYASPQMQNTQSVTSDDAFTQDDFDFDFDDGEEDNGSSGHNSSIEMPEIDDFNFDFTDNHSPKPAPTVTSSSSAKPTTGQTNYNLSPSNVSMNVQPSSMGGQSTTSYVAPPTSTDYTRQQGGSGQGGFSDNSEEYEDFNFDFDDGEDGESNDDDFNFDDGEDESGNDEEDEEFNFDFDDGEGEDSNDDEFNFEDGEDEDTNDDDFNFDFGADDGGDFQDLEDNPSLDFSEEAQEKERQSYSDNDDDFDFNFEDEDADGIGAGGYSQDDDDGEYGSDDYGDTDTDEFGNPRYIETSAGTLDILTHNLLDFLQQLEFDEFLKVLQDNSYVYDRIMADDQWSDEEMEFLRSIEPLVKDSNKIQEVRSQQSFNPTQPMKTGYEDKDVAMMDTRIHKTLAGLYEHIKEKSLALMENNPVKVTHLPNDLAKMWIQDTQDKQSKRIGKMFGSKITQNPHEVKRPENNKSPHSFVSKTQTYYDELTVILSSELMAMSSQLEEDAMNFIKADAERFGEQFTNFLLEKYGTKILFLYLSQMKSDILADKMFDNVMEYIRKYIAPPIPEDFTQDFFRSILRIIKNNNLKI